MGSVSLTARKAKYRADFGPLLPGVCTTLWRRRTSSISSRGHCSAAWSSPSEVAAIVVEPVLGEGGYVSRPRAGCRYLRELCDRHGILLVCDEVQSGMGARGTMWAIEQEGVEPDIILAGKGIAERDAARAP